jgi:hypothetical protein
MTWPGLQPPSGPTPSCEEGFFGQFRMPRPKKKRLGQALDPNYGIMQNPLVQLGLAAMANQMGDIAAV